MLLGATLALAAPPELFLRIPAGDASISGAAGHLGNPRDVAGDPSNGHLFVSDLGNARINEFTAWGAFVKAWGWDVAPEGAPGDTPADQLEVCAASCKAGVEGTSAGQLREPRGIAVDGAGDIYVHERSGAGEPSHRVQKFDAEGNFLLMLGGEVNKTTGADICTKADVEAGDVCGAGVPGSADGWFSNPYRGNLIAYGPASDTIFVGDVGRIQEFDTGGSFIRNIDLEGALDGKAVGAFDVGSSGSFYVGASLGAIAVEPNVHKLDANGKPIGPVFEVPGPEAVAVDVEGTVYAINDAAGVASGSRETWTFTPDGDESGRIPDDQGFVLRAVATNLCASSESPGNLYIVNFGFTEAYVNAFGTPPLGCEPPPTVPPEIETQYAVSAGTGEAVVRAEINPNFFTDTTYYVEYGAAPCALGGCKAVAPQTLTGKPTNAAVRTAGVFLEDLEPDTTYHFRFVAESHGGGPVVGGEGTLHTFATPTPPRTDCPNQAFRTGPGAFLSDCRGYEMVSPLDKNNGDIVSSFNFSTEPTTVYQSAAQGERFTYSSSTSFADPEGAPYTNQYLASRDPEAGWGSEAIAPARTRVATLTEFQKNQFKAFSEDLCMAWLRADADPPLTETALPEYPNLYRRENCGAPSYEALTTAAPRDRVPAYEDIDNILRLEFQGASNDGSRAIFVASDDLEGTTAPDIAEGTGFPRDKTQLYEHVQGGSLRFVCILPSGNTLKETCSAGTRLGTTQEINNRLSNVDDAISADGARIFWTAGEAGIGSGVGRIFLSEGPGPSSQVSGTVSAEEPAFFWGAAEDGSKAIFAFTAGPFEDDLYEFDAATKTPQLIAQEVQGVMGMSEDASRIYLASAKALEGAAVEGQPNLYLYEADTGGGPGQFEFIGTLADSDVSFSGLSSITPTPSSRTTRVSPDGTHAAFTSKAPLTGYDNTDATSGKPDSEVFLYDAEAEELVCVSCNPTGIRPTGSGGVAATLTPWERSLYASRLLSDDGDRVFFESFEALELRDTNGAQDVYQWEVEGSGDCNADKATFNEQSGGCVELISSGQSAKPSIFLDASRSGDDVFLTTLASLVPQDFGLVDVYDARVGGGFPPPPVPDPICEGEACQSPPPAPTDPTPASTLPSAGNPKAKKLCAKGKRLVKRGGKARCVKKKTGKRRNRRGGAGR